MMSSATALNIGPKFCTSSTISSHVLKPRFLCASLSLSAPTSWISLPFSSRSVSSTSWSLYLMPCRSQVYFSSSHISFLQMMRLTCQMRMSTRSFSSASPMLIRAHRLVLPARRGQMTAFCSDSDSHTASCSANSSALSAATFR